MFQLCSFLYRCIKTKWRKKWLWQILILSLHIVYIQNFFKFSIIPIPAISQGLFHLFCHIHTHTHAHKYKLKSLELANPFCSCINHLAFINKGTKLTLRLKKCMGDVLQNIQVSWCLDDTYLSLTCHAQYDTNHYYSDGGQFQIFSATSFLKCIFHSFDIPQ